MIGALGAQEIRADFQIKQSLDLSLHGAQHLRCGFYLMRASVLETEHDNMTNHEVNLSLLGCKMQR